MCTPLGTPCRDPESEEKTMYISVGVIVLILVILLLVGVLR
jgi:hypothetical protein